jgi:predicted nucleic acid-binding protein
MRMSFNVRLQRLAHGRSIAEVDRLLTFLSSKIVPVEIYFRWRPQLLDANDEMFLDAAVNGRVDGIVTHNSKHFIPAARFGIPVFSPAQLLQR